MFRQPDYLSFKFNNDLIYEYYNVEYTYLTHLLTCPCKIIFSKILYYIRTELTNYIMSRNIELKSLVYRRYIIIVSVKYQ